MYFLCIISFDIFLFNTLSFLDVNAFTFLIYLYFYLWKKWIFLKVDNRTISSAFLFFVNSVFFVTVKVKDTEISNFKMNALQLFIVCLFQKLCVKWICDSCDYSRMSWVWLNFDLLEGVLWVPKSVFWVVFFFRLFAFVMICFVVESFCLSEVPFDSPTMCALFALGLLG